MKRIFLALFLLNSFALLGAGGGPKAPESDEQGREELTQDLPVATASEVSVADLRAQIHMLQKQNAKQKEELKAAEELRKSFLFDAPPGYRTLYVYPRGYSQYLRYTRVNIKVEATFGQLVELLKARGDISPNRDYKNISFNLTNALNKESGYKNYKPHQSLEGAVSSHQTIAIKCK